MSSGAKDEHSRIRNSSVFQKNVFFPKRNKSAAPMFCLLFPFFDRNTACVVACPLQDSLINLISLRPWMQLGEKIILFRTLSVYDTCSAIEIVSIHWVYIFHDWNKWDRSRWRTWRNVAFRLLIIPSHTTTRVLHSVTFPRSDFDQVISTIDITKCVAEDETTRPIIFP